MKSAPLVEGWVARVGGGGGGCSLIESRCIEVCLEPRPPHVFGLVLRELLEHAMGCYRRLVLGQAGWAVRQVEA